MTWMNWPPDLSSEVCDMHTVPVDTCVACGDSSAFIDGSRVTPGTERCRCDSDTPLPGGGERLCEWPCWQRVGLTTEACCPDCPPLPDA